jgi:hypothetical protein
MGAVDSAIRVFRKHGGVVRTRTALAAGIHVLHLRCMDTVSHKHQDKDVAPVDLLTAPHDSTAQRMLHSWDSSSVQAFKTHIG